MFVPKTVIQSTRLAVNGSKVAVRARPSTVLARSFASSVIRAEELKKTPLFDFHVKNGAKMVPFAGWSMPLSYGDVGQITSHNHVRNSVGLFDVSHMIQHTFAGPSSLAFLQLLCPSSLSLLSPYSSTLSVLLNEQGGIIDDMLVTKEQDEENWYVVTNAGRSKEDSEWIGAKLEEWNGTEGKGKGQEVVWNRLDGYGLIALQGPQSSHVLQRHTDFDLKNFWFGRSGWLIIDGVKCHVARGGYTGEDGFEISIPPASALALTQRLTDEPETQLIGLGARDSLRLEAGMCLYGHDLDESVSPVEAGLSWLIGKDRRKQADFIGADRVLKELKEGPVRRRVGFEVQGAPAREGAEVYSEDGKTLIGKITSGIPSPTLGTNIAMGYVQSGHHKRGTLVQIKVRRNMRLGVVKAMPFVGSKYFRQAEP